MSNFLFSIEHLTTKIKDTTILENVSCHIPEGQISTIIGSSGAGKSTFLRTLVRLLDYSGNIFFRDNSIQDINVRQLRKQICYVPQVAEMFPGSVKNNILWARNLWKLPTNDDFVDKLLNNVGLNPILAEKEANDLSVGQKQRVCFARSLALEPDVLLLDEPDSALDAISKESFENFIRDLRIANPGLSIIMVTHNLQQASRMGEYVILLDKGRLVSQGESEKFFSEIQSLKESDLLKRLINNNGGN